MMTQNHFVASLHQYNSLKLVDVLWYQQRLIVIHHDLPTNQTVKKFCAYKTDSCDKMVCNGDLYLVFPTMKCVLNE